MNQGVSGALSRDFMFALAYSLCVAAFCILVLGLGWVEGGLVTFLALSLVVAGWLPIRRR